MIPSAMVTVREVMSKEPVTVEPSVTVEAASLEMMTKMVGSALVMRQGRVVGIFTERDIMKALSRNADRGRTMTVREWMSPDPSTIDANSSVGEALDRMLEAGFRHLPVTEDGEVIGIVSMRDLAQSIAKEPRPQPRTS
jgi:CBS domain-containing protein